MTAPTVHLAVEARADWRVDCAYVAEDEDRVVVAAFKCSPHWCDRGRSSHSSSASF